MSNLKHGYYSTNSSINPDSVMIGNISVKQAIAEYTFLIKRVLDMDGNEILPKGALDLVIYLISCINNGQAFHLLPKDYQEKAMLYTGTRTFLCIERHISNTTLSQLVQTYKSFNELAY
jgi:hypothetical protein